MIKLSGFSNISLNDSLYVNMSSFNIIANVSRNYEMNVTCENEVVSDSEIVIDDIPIDDNPISPVIVISQFQDKIGSCNNLTLNARNFYNLGDRSGTFVWYIDNGDASENDTTIILYGNPVELSSDYISIDTKQFQINLILSTWYGGETSVSFTVSGLSLNGIIVPIVWSEAPNDFNIEESMDNNENGLITLVTNFAVVSNLSCLLSKSNIDANVNNIELTDL